MLNDILSEQSIENSMSYRLRNICQGHVVHKCFSFRSNCLMMANVIQNGTVFRNN